MKWQFQYPFSIVLKAFLRTKSHVFRMAAQKPNCSLNQQHMLKFAIRLGLLIFNDCSPILLSLNDFIHLQSQWVNRIPLTFSAIFLLNTSWRMRSLSASSFTRSVMVYSRNKLLRIKRILTNHKIYMLLRSCFYNC